MQRALAYSKFGSWVSMVAGGALVFSGTLLGRFLFTLLEWHLGFPPEVIWAVRFCSAELLPGELLGREMRGQTMQSRRWSPCDSQWNLKC